MDNMIFIDPKLVLISNYNMQKDAFLSHVETVHPKIEMSISNFFSKVKKEMEPWQKNFFIYPEDDYNFSYCPGPNIDKLIFLNGLNNNKKSELNLYTLEWLFSVAMGIYIMQSKNIEYFGISDKTILIDSKMHARILNLCHNYYENETITPYPLFFYSPEKCLQFISQECEIILDENQKKKSDVYSYGVFLHELVTSKKQSKVYFNNLPKSQTITKLQNGAIKYMNLEEDTNIPFYDLICACLQRDSDKRCQIEYVIEQLLKPEKAVGTSAPSNKDYFDINYVDMNKYHQFINEVCGFQKDLDFSIASDRIISMIHSKSELKTENIEIENKCSFDDLEKGYKSGLLFCHETLQKCRIRLSRNDLNLYNNFISENPEISEFTVMKVFYQNKYIESQLHKHLNELSQKYNKCLNC